MPSNQDIEKHRADWSAIAKENGWYFEPFYIQIWHRDDGTIVDSVGYIAMQDRNSDLLILTN